MTHRAILAEAEYGNFEGDVYLEVDHWEESEENGAGVMILTHVDADHEGVAIYLTPFHARRLAEALLNLR